MTLLSQHKVTAGNYIEVKPTGTGSAGSYPHKTEDLIVDGKGMRPCAGPKPVWIGKGAPPSSSTVVDAFEKHLLKGSTWAGGRKVHVAEGTRTKSLVAVELSAAGLAFFEDDYNGTKSLRVILDDGSPEKFNFPVTSVELRHLYRSKGIDAVQKFLPARGKVHVRLGLARPLSQRCSAMVNGIMW